MGIVCNRGERKFGSGRQHGAQRGRSPRVLRRGPKQGVAMLERRHPPTRESRARAVRYRSRSDQSVGPDVREPARVTCNVSCRPGERDRRRGPKPQQTTRIQSTTSSGTRRRDQPWESPPAPHRARLVRHPDCHSTLRPTPCSLHRAPHGSAEKPATRQHRRGRSHQSAPPTSPGPQRRPTQHFQSLK